MCVYRLVSDSSDTNKKVFFDTLDFEAINKLGTFLGFGIRGIQYSTLNILNIYLWYISHPFRMSSAAHEVPEGWSMLIIQDVHRSVYDAVYVLLTMQHALVVIFVFFNHSCNKHIMSMRLVVDCKSREKRLIASLFIKKLLICKVEV